VTWNYDEPEPTALPSDEDPFPEEPFPEEPFPEEPFPEEPFPEDDFPPPSQPTQANSIGLTPPTVTVIWGKKRQEDDVEPTSAPELPADEEDDDDGSVEIPANPAPTQPNSVGINPPTYTVIWGKEKRAANAAPEPTAAPAVAERAAEAEAEPQNSIGLEFPWQSVTWPKPSPPSYISWGKRESDAEPTAVPEKRMVTVYVREREAEATA
jgi:hypothetical protein